MNESPDLWVMFRPAQVFTHLLEVPAGRSMALRRPLMLILMLAAFVSLATSGRLSLRLLLAGAECAVFLPPLMIASLALIPRRPAIPFARLIDLFFLGHGPWTLWIVAFASLWAFVPADQAYYWFHFRPLWLAPAGAAFLWSAYIDFCFLRCVFRRTPGQALRDLTVQRTLAWTPGLAIFLGAGGWQVVASRFGW